MPYTEAVIYEVLRRSTIIPLGVFHTALADKEFGGYVIEKGSWLTANVWGIHFDKEIWGDDAESFRPERFLSPDETKVVKNEAFIPFLIGKRQCLGESLARDTLFLFITYIFQTFKVKLHLPNGEKPNYEPTLALLLSPQKFHVILENRL
jgi:methyl farnesoate epoxidase/farnesoate epoxidase